MLTVCRNCNEVFHHEDGKCPYCKTPVPELPHEYEVKKAKILAEKEIAVKKICKEQGRWGSALLAGIVAIIAGFILMSVVEDRPDIGFITAIVGVAVAILCILGLMGATISDEYDKRLEELNAEYFPTSAEYEKIIKAYIDKQKIPAKQPGLPKVADDQHMVKCPTCGSNDCERISTASKAVDAAAFGLYGNKRNKQFRCRNCKYMW